MTLKIFIITGEESGDRLGAAVIEQARKSQQNFDIEFSGIGGERMRSLGFGSIFPIEDIAVMGLTEIIPKLPTIFSRLDQTVRAIEEFQPDVVLSIDCPDFSLRVQKRIKKKALPIRQVHYVAPTVWAWRPGRARSIAQYLDKILCLYPFEPPYFEKAGLNAEFVGHPIVDRHVPQISKNEFRSRHNMPEASQIAGLYVGSRRGEVENHAPVFAGMVEQLVKAGKADTVKFVVPTFENFLPALKNHFSKTSDHIVFVTNDNDKEAAMSVMSAAACVNGTVGLELAMARVPHITCYKAGRLTAFIARQLINLQHMHLVNILRDHNCLGPAEAGPVVPEFIQNDVDARNMSNQLLRLIESPEEQRKQKLAFESLQQTLRPDNYGTPTAQAVLNNITDL